MSGDHLPPSGWKRVHLGEVAAIEVGGTPTTEVQAYWGGSVPWMTSGDVHLRRISDVPGRITNEGLAKSNAKLVGPPTVAVALAGQGKTRGTVAFVACTLASNQSVALIKGAQNTLSTSYLFYELDNRYEELRARSSGGGRGGLSVQILSRLPLNLPPLPEQLRIAAILESVDDTIRSIERLIAKFEQAKQGLLHDLLSGRDHLQNQWRAYTLGELVDHARPIVYGILMPGKGQQNGVPVIKVKDIRDDEIQQDDLLLTSCKIDEEYRRSRVQPGDLLFTIRGTVGRMAFVPSNLAGANITQDTARISITKANRRFVWYSLRMPAVQSFISLHTLGQAVKGINLRDVRKIPIMLPSITDQGKIAESLDAATDQITYESERLRLLRSLRSGLRNDLLTGRVRVGALA
jgi:type I restriction enzyme S subunit